MRCNSKCTTCNSYCKCIYMYILYMYMIHTFRCLTQEIRSRYPSHDGLYRDYKSTFEAETEYEAEAEFPPREYLYSKLFSYFTIINFAKFNIKSSVIITYFEPTLQMIHRVQSNSTTGTLTWLLLYSCLVI